MEETMKLSYKQRTGHERTKFAHKNSNWQSIMRKKSACERLEEQLKSGKKRIKDIIIPLEEEDIKRIKKEISILKTYF